MSSVQHHKSNEVSEDISNWINFIKSSADFVVNEITLDQAYDWLFENGSIHHTSRRFFNIVGVKSTDLKGLVSYYPLIEQREVGTLGFIWRDINTEPELLIHAKIEPGNIGIVQLAPSCQATESNMDRVHGGDIPPYSDIFDNNQVDVISRSLQSEQGSRFLGKMNNNILASLKNNKYPDSDIHKWFPVSEVLKMLKIDYLLNTDARSVLVCSDWKKLVGRDPFTLDNSKLSRELSTSLSRDGLFKTIRQIKERVKMLRERVAPVIIIPLTKLPGYYISDYGIFPKNKRPFCVKYIDVKTGYREVKRWNQPIIESSGVGRVDLICGRINGILHFLFRPVVEPGLLNKVELSPSEIIEPGEECPTDQKDKERVKVLIQSWQSDEGGRFYQDKSLYRIIDMGSVYSVPESWVWLSLKQVRHFLEEGGWLTNEARSALSLLLTWL